MSKSVSNSTVRQTKGADILTINDFILVRKALLKQNENMAKSQLTLKAQISELESRLSQQEEEAVSLRDTNKHLLELQSQYKDREKHKEAKLIKIKKAEQHNELLTQKRINELQQQYATLEQHKEELQSLNKEIQQQNKSLQQHQEELQTHITEIQQKTISLEQNQENLQVRINESQEQNTNLQQSNQDLEKSMNLIQQQNTLFQENQKTLDSRIIEVQQHNNTLQNDKKELQKHITMVELQIEEEQKRAAEEISVENQNNQALREQIKFLQIQTKDLEGQLEQEKKYSAAEIKHEREANIALAAQILDVEKRSKEAEILSQKSGKLVEEAEKENQILREMNNELNHQLVLKKEQITDTSLFNKGQEVSVEYTKELNRIVGKTVTDLGRILKLIDNNSPGLMTELIHDKNVSESLQLEVSSDNSADQERLVTSRKSSLKSNNGGKKKMASRRNEKVVEFHEERQELEEEEQEPEQIIQAEHNDTLVEEFNYDKGKTEESTMATEEYSVLELEEPFSTHAPEVIDISEAQSNMLEPPSQMTHEQDNAGVEKRNSVQMAVPVDQDEAEDIELLSVSSTIKSSENAEPDSLMEIAKPLAPLLSTKPNSLANVSVAKPTTRKAKKSSSKKKSVTLVVPEMRDTDEPTKVMSAPSSPVKKKPRRTAIGVRKRVTIAPTPVEENSKARSQQEPISSLTEGSPKPVLVEKVNESKKSSESIDEKDMVVRVRRSRAGSISYALPSLRTKMRRQADSFADAVTDENGEKVVSATHKKRKRATESNLVSSKDF